MTATQRIELRNATYREPEIPAKRCGNCIYQHLEHVYTGARLICGLVGKVTEELASCKEWEKSK